ncbi:hypothetical protein [Paraburkholderia phytofirmans]|uniref:hypothetical protein n=1 Tax=Paraburkholderia TaxID=1822464 RepID=UPI00131407B6|nr:hypothetical protein [Paraburkholderia phytofirmans]
MTMTHETMAVSYSSVLRAASVRGSCQFDSLVALPSTIARIGHARQARPQGAFA